MHIWIGIGVVQRIQICHNFHRPTQAFGAFGNFVTQAKTPDLPTAASLAFDGVRTQLTVRWKCVAIPNGEVV
jgi:hypothetical protein